VSFLIPNDIRHRGDHWKMIHEMLSKKSGADGDFEMARYYREDFSFDPDKHYTLDEFHKLHGPSPLELSGI